MSDLAIRIQGIGKRYRLGHGSVQYKTLRSTITNAIREPIAFAKRHAMANDQNTFWALRDVSLDVQAGERIGIIGRNGAGKSTLLKILSRITEPTVGRAELRGRVGSLLEVGTGFHPELTGRENVFLNGAILGMSRAEIARRFDEIVAFAEMEKFLDTQAKFYSSGMYTRLAFAVAAHLEPEILIVDEVLAVGDVSFQEKSLGKMRQVAQEGRTVIFVSHNMAAISSLCSKAFLLKQGQLVSSGDPNEVIKHYIASNRAPPTSLRERADRLGDGRVRLVGISTVNEKGDAVTEVICGQQVGIALDYESSGTEDPRRVIASIEIFGILGDVVLYCQNEMAGNAFDSIPQRGRIVCHFPKLALVPGRYDLSVAIDVKGIPADRIVRAASMTVAEGDFFGTGRLPPANQTHVMASQSWKVEGTAS